MLEPARGANVPFAKTLIMDTKLHKVDDAGGVWALMDALQVLDDLLKMQ